MSANNNIWSAILKTTSSSKRIHTKNVLLLGDPGSGKSTLAHYLKHPPNIKVESNGHYDNKLAEQHKEASFIRTVASGGYVKAVKQDLDAEATKMLGVGYTSALVHDQNDEGTTYVNKIALPFTLRITFTSHTAILRLGIYQLDDKQLFSLLDPVLTDDNLFGIIVLDWTKPWVFLESLELWMSVLKRWSTKIVTAESKARVKEYLQKYGNQSNDSINNTNPDVAAAELHSAFTVNLGIPIAVVCCKSDTQKMLEERYGYGEAQLDYIQQTLRCICMKYGAALFYTSTFHPSTLYNLRQYIVHRSDPTIPSTIQPQQVESTSVLIPAGWDTWEKIKTLEEDYLLNAVDRMRDDIIQNQLGDGITKVFLSIYREALPDPGHENKDPGLQYTVTNEDEQVLYGRYFQQSFVVRSPPPPSLSTTFLRELKDWESSTYALSSEDIIEKYTSLPLLSSTRRIEMETGTVTATGKISAPTVSVYTTSTVNTISSSMSNASSIVDNNNTTNFTTFSSSVKASSTSSNNIEAIASPSSEIVSQFFQKLLYNNMERTESLIANSNGIGDTTNRRSHTSVADSSMHNSQPSCVNTT